MGVQEVAVVVRVVWIGSVVLEVFFLIVDGTAVYVVMGRVGVLRVEVREFPGERGSVFARGCARQVEAVFGVDSV